ncbi:MAG TPA: RelA/SpoT family protein [Candidatus Paceibacterota bacterium]|nr:RelA/SpoT family protein [Candidatus Paceibacterota bacterium]
MNNQKNKIKKQIVENLELNFGKLEEKDKELLKKAFEWVETYHSNQKRLTGESFINHPLRVALTLSLMKLDINSVIGGLLHDIIEDGGVELISLKKNFNEEIAFLVQGVTKISSLNYKETFSDEEAENFRNMILSMSKDLRVILIKLADRLDNLKTLWVLDKKTQKIKALQTLEILAPIAYRLGLTKIGAQLEDLSFPYAYPQEYRLTKTLSGKRQKELENYLKKIVPLIEKELKDNNLKPINIKYRAKHLYSIWRKLQKEDMDITRIYDLVAIRIIFQTVEECYSALGVIHQYYKPVPNRFKDYIALPKPNGYRSLHTTVFTKEGKVLEIQIRTQEMDEEAEWGIAGYWFYQLLKDSKIYKKRKGFQIPRHLNWLNQIKKWKDSFSTSRDFLEAVKIDFFKNRIFVLTPKGDIIDLPEGATPIDFAYQIHSEIGNHAIGAKVNDKIVPLDYKLQSGEVVEIITQKNKLPSPSWLEFVKMTDTKKKVQQTLKKTKILPLQSKKNFICRLEILAENKVGLLDLVSNLIAKQNINIIELNGKTIKNKAFLTFKLKIKYFSHLETLLKHLKQLKEIKEIKVDYR